MQQQVNMMQGQLNTMLNRKLTWLHSSPPMTWDVLLKVPEGAYRFFAESPWLEIPRYLDNYRSRHPLRTAFSLILLGALVYSRRKLLGRLAGMKDKIGRVGRDKFRHTLEALACREDRSTGLFHVYAPRRRVTDSLYKKGKWRSEVPLPGDPVPAWAHPVVAEQQWTGQ